MGKSTNSKGNLLEKDLRIVSLIPSATEIVAQLGYGEYLVGRSHECDFPSDVQTLPVCTEPKFDPVGTSREIHERVTELLATALSVYRVNVPLLAKLRPTHIITQAQCEVCAVSLSDVEQAVTTLAQPEDTPIKIVSLQPEKLADVWTDIARVAEAFEPFQTSPQTAKASAQKMIESLQARLPTPSKTNQSKTSPSKTSPSKTSRSKTSQDEKDTPKKVVCIEWTDPLMAAGNWVPELVAIAGGQDCCGQAGKHSDWMSWETLTAADPDIIVVMPCGYDMAQTRTATEAIATSAQWQSLKAVKSNQVYLTDGNQYFNRPGPRLVESAEILAEIIHQQSANPNRHPVGWEKF
ncbi:MAG: cobalamin-binding protein [Cyanobacteria bacterium J06598_1]